MKPIQLTDDELILQNDFDDTTARQAIRAYVMADTPIPNELKPFLLDLLQQPYKGKSKADTATYWRSLVMEVCFLIQEEGIKQFDAISQIAYKHDLPFDTVERRYKSSAYRFIKDSIKGVK